LSPYPRRNELNTEKMAAVRGHFFLPGGGEGYLFRAVEKPLFLCYDTREDSGISGERSAL
ncbi:hypothetical protein, partial [uncultured Intestinimonas sp.]|uniref:hypothetical protein n=1 Tax=uncultured Intestinimonas sp. TaxID=1689265 RepID=UPI0025D66337